MLRASEAAPSPRVSRRSPARADMLVGLMLMIVMLTGGYFRFVGLNWDEFIHFHPDERFLTGVASSLGGGLRSSLASPIEQQAQIDRCLERYPNTGGIGAYFDTECSTLNPHNTGHGLYVYGTLPLFMARGAADVIVDLTGDRDWSGYNGVHLVWRGLSALAETLTILVVFLIGHRLHDKWVGLAAALLYAGAAFSIQQAHFGTADATSNFFVALTLLFAARVQFGGRWRDYALFGVALGAALASRVNIAPLAGVVGVAALIYALPALAGGVSRAERDRLIFSQTGGLILAAILTILVFRIFNPYAFSGPGFFGLTPNPRWLADLRQAQHLVSGNAEMPPNWQWAGRTRYLFAFGNMTLWGMGIALGLAGWAAWAAGLWRLIRGRADALRNATLLAWVLVYFGWLGGNWVASMRYFLPLYAPLAVLAAWGLLALIRGARRPIWRGAGAALAAAVMIFTILWGAMFTSVYRNPMTAAQASRWIIDQIPADFAMQVEGAPEGTPLINIPIINRFGGDDLRLEERVTRFETGQPYTTLFTAPADGIIRTVHSPHLGQLINSDSPVVLRVAIADPSDTIQFAEAILADALPRFDHPLGGAYDLELDVPLGVRAGEDYRFTVEVVAGGPVISGGAVFTWEGDWDEPVPPKVCQPGLDVTMSAIIARGLGETLRACQGVDLWSSHINGHKLQVIYEDDESKRARFQQVLDETDYLIIGTNRRYDSQSRIPVRWPMTLRYYDALFNGELGFELEAIFQETFELGPLRVSSQHLPFYDSPAWLNEFEAEEAFHVYDHPVVMIFRKTEAYSSENTRAILESAPLNRVNAIGMGGFVEDCPTIFLSPGGGGCDTTLVDTVPLSSMQAADAPTQLMLSPDRRAIQFSNGTWSDLFDRNSLINAQPVASIVIWWLAIMAFGWAAWPLLFALFPAFGDRGYSISKISGLLLVSWLAWMGSSAGLRAWSGGGMALILAGLFGLGLIIAWRHRAELMPFVRAYGRRLLLIELITLAAFLAFLAVRLTNPDLWHTSFGGEKPMDFAYFNGVLRSTVFPPLDPWYAGGYINYYYYGFVLVGTPVLLLGMVPSVAYNLILPTLFALTGIGAFGVAFNLVAGWRERRADAESDAPARLGNPWIAGIAALIMAVGLGNLDTPRVFGTGLANLGGYQPSQGLEWYLVDQYTQANGAPPSDSMRFELMQQAQENRLGDRLAYELHLTTSLVSSIGRGVGQFIGGQPLPLAPHRWYWAPTRILAETPGVEGNAIAEMPYFTFLYGDLHAHMISMPLMLLAMALVLNEVLQARADRRRPLTQAVALAIFALTVGILRATNTWDWITFMILGVLALGYAWWLRWGRVDRRALIDMALRVGGFIVLSFVLTIPFLTWYATAAYGGVLLWEGGKTPLWAYFSIHGVFVFLVTSLLAWETGRWLRSTYVRALRGLWAWLIAMWIGATLLLLGVLMLTALGYQATLIALPLIVWIAVVFFRPGQSPQMQVALVLAGLALALTLGVEFVVLAGDIGRQNTVFKFYIQAWLLFSVAGGAAFAWLLQGSDSWSGALRNLWFGAAMILFTVAALYPIMATMGRAQDRMAPGMPMTLDGMEYMQYATHGENGEWFALADDYHMIRWLQDNVQGTPVIIESQSWREYLWGGRVAIYTGLPTVLGWRFHQTQQRTFEPMHTLINQRRANVNGFYSTDDMRTAWRMIEFYEIDYIIVGALERAYYPESGLMKFDLMVEMGLADKVYEQGLSTVYRVNRTMRLEQAGDAG